MPLLAVAGVAAAVALTAGCGDDATTVRQAGVPPPARDPAQRYEISATVLEDEEHGPEVCIGEVAASYPPQCGGPEAVGWDWSTVDGEETFAGVTWGEYRLVGTFDGERFTPTEPPGPPVPREEASDRPPPACDDPTGDAAGDTAGDADVLGFDESSIPGLVALWVSPADGGRDGPFTVSVLVRPGGAAAAEAVVRRTWSGPLCVVERDLPSQAELRAFLLEVLDEADRSPLGTVYVGSADERRGVVVLEVAVADEVTRAWAAERWGDRVELVGRLRPVR